MEWTSEDLQNNNYYGFFNFKIVVPKNAVITDTSNYDFSPTKDSFSISLGALS